MEEGANKLLVARDARSIRSQIRYYVICQRSKAPTLKPTCLLQPLEILNMNWEVANMDLIFGLEPFSQGYDAIFVFG